MVFESSWTLDLHFSFRPIAKDARRGILESAIDAKL